MCLSSRYFRKREDLNNLNICSSLIYNTFCVKEIQDKDLVIRVEKCITHCSSNFPSFKRNHLYWILLVFQVRFYIADIKKLLLYRLDNNSVTEVYWLMANTSHNCPSSFLTCVYFPLISCHKSVLLTKYTLNIFVNHYFFQAVNSLFHFCISIAFSLQCSVSFIWHTDPSLRAREREESPGFSFCTLIFSIQTHHCWCIEIWRFEWEMESERFRNGFRFYNWKPLGCLWALFLQNIWITNCI